jgi:hypothetical protein
VELSEQLSSIAEAARGFAGPGEELAAVIPAEPAAGVRVYLCAYREGGENRSWLGLDDEGRPIESRAVLRDAVSIAALCEVAEEVAGGGRLEELRSELVALRLTENPPGIDEAEEATLTLERVVGTIPRVASPVYLDDVGAASRRLEQALGEIGRSPFAEALKQAVTTVDELSKDVEANYKVALA